MFLLMPKTDSKSRRCWHVMTVLMLVVGIISIQFSGFQSVRAEEEEFPTIETRFTLGLDWLITLNTTTMDHMLNYPGSLIHPITQVRVTYFTFDGRKQTWSKGKIYQDLWFSNGRPVGCRRYTRLPFQNGSYGAIYVARTRDCVNQTRALDGTIVRLFLDLALNNSVISSVVLPLEICDNAASDLGSFNFYQATMITAGRLLMLHFQSYPRNFDKYFVHIVK